LKQALIFIIKKSATTEQQTLAYNDHLKQQKKTSKLQIILPLGNVLTETKYKF